MELKFNDYKNESDDDLNYEVKLAQSIGDQAIFRVSYWTPSSEDHRFFTEEDEALEVYNAHALNIKNNNVSE